MAKTVQRLERVPLREIWPDEARDFTSWLAENLDLLGEVLGMQLSLVQPEHMVGPFAVDILAETADGSSVVIENQLERTDHDHLGKLITYLTNLDAKAAVWLCRDPRQEHINAVNWLNEVAPEDTAVFLLTVEAYKIGDSPPAPMLAVIAGPSPEAKDIGRGKKEVAGRQRERMEFWRQLLERASDRSHPHRRISPGKQSYISAGAGKSGLSFSYVILLDRASVELYIDTGEGERNKGIFDQLSESREEVERAFGASLLWERLDDRRASRISYKLESGGLTDRDRWPEIQDAMVETMIRFHKALKPRIRSLRT